MRVCSLVVVMTLLGGASLQAANLLQNGDFEAPAAESLPGWSLNAEARQQKVWAAATDPHAGRQCLAWRSTTATPKVGVLSQEVAVEPGKRYSLTVWLKRDSFVYGTGVEVQLLKGAGLVDTQEVAFRGVTWSPVCMTFSTGAANRARVAITNPNTGDWRITVGRTLYVDDVSLVPVDPADNVELSAGNRPALQARAEFKQTGPYYVWARVQCAGNNAFTLQVGGKSYDFHCYTRGQWYWLRPILPELILGQGPQDIRLSSVGDDIQIDRVVFTLDPFYKPPQARAFMDPAQAKAALLQAAGPPGSGAVTLTVSGTLPPGVWGLTQGVPFPQGALRDPARVRLAGHPCQAEALMCWPDGSIKSLLISTLAAAGEQLELTYGPAVTTAAASPAVRVTDTPQAVTVDTGKLTFRVPRDGSALLADMQCGGRRIERVDALVNRDFTSAGVAPQVQVEEAGPVRAAIRIAGQHRSPAGQKLLDYVVRVYAYAGADSVEIEHSFIQNEGKPKVELSQVALRLQTPLTRYALQVGEKPVAGTLAGGPVELAAALTSNPKANNDFPYQVTQGAQKLAAGTQAEGRFVCDDLCVTVRDFWQNAPRSLRVAPAGLEIGLVGAAMPFYIGMAKTSHVLLSFNDPAAAEVFAQRPLLLAPAEWTCASGALNARPAPRREGQFPAYEQCMDRALADWAKRTRDAQLKPGWGGMLNYGDAVYSSGGLNMETALDEGAMVQFFRTGRRDCFDFADAMINHYTDIDLCHAGANAGLLYAHGPHSRTSLEAVRDGINGHSWYNGVIQYACFTGSRRILETAPLVGRYYATYPFPLQPYIHYWRQIGWKCMDLVQAYQVTGDVQWLGAALEDVRVHEYQRDHLVTLWPYMYATGMKALRMYYDSTGDPEVRELYLQLLDGFLHLRERPDDTVNGEWPKAPGMLLGNFPNDRSCLFYNEPAQATWLTGDRRFLKLAGDDLNWQLVFGLSDPTLLSGSADLVRGMQEAGIAEPRVRDSLPSVTMTPWLEGADKLPQYDRPTIVFQVNEAQDQAFEVVLFKSSLRKYTDDCRGRATLHAPDGKAVGEQPVHTGGMNKFHFAVPADGQTGLYTLVVSLDDYWRWTLAQVDVDLKAGTHVLGLRPRYDRIFLDQLCVAKAGGFFPTLMAQPGPEAVMIEAETGPLPPDFVLVKDAFASGGVCVRATKGDSGSTLERTFSVPADGTYRLFARIWKPQSDLLNVTVDGQGQYVLQGVHDMDNNTFPTWSLGCSLGDGSIARYWLGEPVRNAAPYSAAYVKPTPALQR
ncbi:hypothetical protein LLH23_05075 [bacterium]|nr:hypothetical protein [bacterium]